ncbi:MAG: hypothetical protein AB7O88_02030 [Reyranellaceae bacterium]
MTSRIDTTPLRRRTTAITWPEYELRVERIAINAGCRFGRGNVALKAGYVFTPAMFERERAAMLTRAGIPFKKN